MMASGVPYAVYKGISNKATVMKFSSGAWTTVGSADFSAGVAEFPCNSHR